MLGSWLCHCHYVHTCASIYPSWAGCSTPSQWFIAHEKSVAVFSAEWYPKEKKVAMSWGSSSFSCGDATLPKVQHSLQSSTGQTRLPNKMKAGQTWRVSGAEQEYSLLKAQVKHDWVLSPNGWVTAVVTWNWLFSYETVVCLRCLVWWRRSWPVKNWKCFPIVSCILVSCETVYILVTIMS